MNSPSGKRLYFRASDFDQDTAKSLIRIDEAMRMTYADDPSVDLVERINSAWSDNAKLALFSQALVKAYASAIAADEDFTLN